MGRAGFCKLIPQFRGHAVFDARDQGGQHMGPVPMIQTGHDKFIKPVPDIFQSLNPPGQNGWRDVHDLLNLARTGMDSPENTLAHQKRAVVECAGIAEIPDGTDRA
jgi:hypothetical protein